MDSKDLNLDLVFRTEINKKTCNLKWSIGNANNIPEIIKSPLFSFTPEHNKDWYLTALYKVDNSICVLLNRDSKDKQPIKVESTTCVTDANDEKFSITVRNLFHCKETRVICNHLCTFPDSALDCTLNLEFNFILYGLEIETKVSYCDDDGVGDAEENRKNLGNMLKNENLVDVQITVGKEVFTAHKFILRLRAPKFVDKHLRYGKKTTLRNIDSEIFKCLISYIYKNELSTVELSQCPKELYEIASTYDLKGLQKICTEELRKDLKIENVVGYLKMSVKHKEDSLKRAASLFIGKHLDIMYLRTDWTTLIASSPSLESEVLHYFR